MARKHNCERQATRHCPCGSTIRGCVDEHLVSDSPESLSKAPGVCFQLISTQASHSNTKLQSRTCASPTLPATAEAECFAALIGIAPGP